MRAGLSELNFERVQSKVLPKFGFENSKKGVMQSMQAFAPYSDSDVTVIRNNAIMTWLITPEIFQAISVEEYVEKTAGPQIAAAEAAAVAQVTQEIQVEVFKGK